MWRLDLDDLGGAGQVRPSAVSEVEGLQHRGLEDFDPGVVEGHRKLCSSGEAVI